MSKNALIKSINVFTWVGSVVAWGRFMRLIVLISIAFTLCFFTTIWIIIIILCSLFMVFICSALIPDLVVVLDYIVNVCIYMLSSCSVSIVSVSLVYHLIVTLGTKHWWIISWLIQLLFFFNLLTFLFFIIYKLLFTIWSTTFIVVTHVLAIGSLVFVFVGLIRFLFIPTTLIELHSTWNSWTCSAGYPITAAVCIIVYTGCTCICVSRLCHILLRVCSWVGLTCVSLFNCLDIG